MFALITERPFVGYLGALTGFASGMLTVMHVLTPIIGFSGALFGAVAGYLTLLIKWREYKAQLPK